MEDKWNITEWRGRSRIAMVAVITAVLITISVLGIVIGLLVPSLKLAGFVVAGIIVPLVVMALTGLLHAKAVRLFWSWIE